MLANSHLIGLYEVGYWLYYTILDIFVNVCHYIYLFSGHMQLQK